MKKKAKNFVIHHSPAKLSASALRADLEQVIVELANLTPPRIQIVVKDSAKKARAHPGNAEYYRELLEGLGD